MYPAYSILPLHPVKLCTLTHLSAAYAKQLCEVVATVHTPADQCKAYIKYMKHIR